MTCCAIIPVYNHGDALAAVVHAIRRHELPCILVDDGSAPDCAAVIDQLAATLSLDLVRLPANQGKGAAVMAGLRRAKAAGHDHALQIDADGQHDSEDIPALLALSAQHPNAVISGRPVYDDSVPKARLYGRYITHAWVWINTLSPVIRDAMCGFRVYPLASVLPLINQTRLGQRMDFDIEVLVRLHWQGVRIIQTPTHVYYPLDGISHFKAVRDNLLISRMHARLFLGMLARLPLLLWRLTIRRQAEYP